MPPEPLPWDRKDFSKERKVERFSEPIGSASRWRETPHQGSFSSREFNRWGSAELRSRTSGHGKQGGWHVYSEEAGHGFTPSRPSDKIVDDESFRSSGTSRLDGKFSRNCRETRGSFSHKDCKGHPSENGASTNGPSRAPDLRDQRSVGDTVTHNSHPHSNSVDSWDQFHLKDQRDKSGSVNGFCPGQKFEKENSLKSMDWKPLKWNRSGSLSSRGSGFSNSSSSKSTGVDSAVMKAEVPHRNVPPVHFPSGDAIACATSAAPAEETSSRKKPRLNWGEGLAKFEKKNVEGSDDSATKHGMVVCGNSERLNFHVSNLSDKSPGVAGLSECASPATPSSVGCSSSPGVGDKAFVKVTDTANDICNLSGSSSLLSPNEVKGTDFSLENLDLTRLAYLSSSLGDLLQSDDRGCLDSSYVRSTAMRKLLVLKVDMLKALEMTESQIDLLENELKSLTSESGNSCPCPAGSSSLQEEHQAKPCEVAIVASNVIPRPAPLQIISSEDMLVEKPVGSLEEEHGQSKDEDIDSPGTVTSKFIEPLSLSKNALSESMKHRERSADFDASKSGNKEVECLYGSNDSEAEASPDSQCGIQLTGSNSSGIQLTAGNSSALCLARASLHCNGRDIFYDQILASNKDSATRASEVFIKLLPSEQCHIERLQMSAVSSWQNNKLIKEKFATRKRFLRFKERVITLKFRAFQHLWKEDMRLISIRKYRAKSQRRLEVGWRTLHGGYQKHRSSIRSRFSSPVRNLNLVPTTEIINFASKLLADSQVKLYRNSLKMPALILDRKEKVISSFISRNGLVEDPRAVEKERALINSWTSEEKEIFMDNLGSFGKDFRKIASFLDHKTTADCIDFYYKNHKSDWFVKAKKDPECVKQGKSRSTSTYLVTSEKRWNRETNAASLDMLGAASAIAAANTDSLVRRRQLCTSLMGVTGDYRARRGEDCTLDRSGSLDVCTNERETVAAADVLAGFCGSLSSEALSSCITSSFDPVESYQDWTCQKVGSSTRRPLTPEMTQNVDGGTCSDESCGEMDPTDWTDEEKSILIQAVSSYGKDFTMISRCVRTRSRNQCKVFFSKARKCLGLDMICPRPCKDEIQVSSDDNGGGSANEDACVLETTSLICSDKSNCKKEEDVLISDLNHCEPDPAETMKMQSADTAETMKMQSADMIADDWQRESKLQLDSCVSSKMESVDRVPLAAQAQMNTALLPNAEAGRVEASGDGNLLEESFSTKGGGDHCLSVAPHEHKTLLVGPKWGGQELASEINVTKQDENANANSSGPSDLNCSDQNSHMTRNAVDHAVNANAPMGLGLDAKQEDKSAVKFNSLPEPHVISLGQDVPLANLNSTTVVPAASQSEKVPNLDVPSAVDVGNISVKHCRHSVSPYDKNQYESDCCRLDCATTHILRGYPLQVPMKKETDGNGGSRKLDSLRERLLKLDRNLHSDMYSSRDCFLQKCGSSKAQSSVAELTFLSQDQKTDHSRSPRSSTQVEKPCRNGDVKLFGQILTHPSSQQKQNSDVTNGNEDKGVPKLSSKDFNLKVTGTHGADGGKSVPLKVDHNINLDVDNVPARSYGFWDGKRIQTGLPCLPESAILMAKYPAAFGKYSITAASQMEQQPLCAVLKSNEHNLNGLSVFSTREISRANGVADYQLYRNLDCARIQPFTVDMKQRQEMLFPELQRQNGFEALSSMQSQARGMLGVNVVGRGGIIVGGACTGVSDPVAAIKMHYAKTEQYGGQLGSNIMREDESWRGKGDIGR